MVISGAKVIDGSGNPWYYADIGIRGDTIAAVGQLGNATAAQRIDARGMIVSPGFIDIHSHGRRGILQVPTAENYLREGVTTIVEGPDGSSPLPIKDFLDSIRRTPISINLATMVGQGSIRQQVIGSVNRKATAEEMAKMKEIAAQAMRDGAFGLSTGLFYVPGNFTPTEEVIELAKVVGAMGGIHISHMREEASHVLDSVRETIRIGEEGGLPTQITHHKTIGQASWERAWSRSNSSRKRVRAAWMSRSTSTHTRRRARASPR
jgi:dihydroorotase/N-acyl-D-amino-acid deacylase